MTNHEADRSELGDGMIQLSKWAAARQQMSGWTAAIALCLALLGVASGSIFFILAEQTMTPNAIAFDRLVIAAIAFALWNGIQALRSPQVLSASTSQPTRMDLALLGIAGTSFAGFLLLLAWSLTQTSVANAAVLTHMMPIFTTLGAWLFLGKRFSSQFLVGLVVAVLGAVAIGVDDFTMASNGLMGDGAALMSAMFLAVEILIVEQLRPRFSTSIITMSECAIASALILPTALLSGTALFPPSWQSALPILGLALITQMLGHGLLTYSLKQFSAGVVAIALLSVPIIATLLAMLMFAQTISGLNAIAFAIILIGIYLSISAPKVATFPDQALEV